MTDILIGAAVLSALSVFLYWSDKSIVIARYTYAGGNLPPSFDGLRVTQVSDLQSQRFGKRQQNLLDSVYQTQPDIIVFTGDLIDRNHTCYERSVETMKRLRAVAPVYYVNGNHEMDLPANRMYEVYEALSQAGIEVLFDRGVKINRGEDSINIIGLSEHIIFRSVESGENRGEKYDGDIISHAVDLLVHEISPDEMTVMITHEPQYFDMYRNEKIDLIFAGHAHGGQIRIPFSGQGLFSPGQGVLPKLTSGIHKRGATTMVISRGLGNSTFPFRVFNRPEIVSVTLKCE